MAWFHCQSCDFLRELSDEHAGKPAKCPKCGKRGNVRTTDANTAPVIGRMVEPDEPLAPASEHSMGSVASPLQQSEAEDSDNWEYDSRTPAVPPIRQPIPVSLQHLAIPVNYTPDGFRALSSWFQWLVFIPFLGPLGLALFLRLVGFLCGLGGVIGDILIVSFFVGLVLAALAGIAAIVVHFILLYRFWRLIQDGKVRTTPAKALWFFAIPFFNFYWWYVAYVGLAEDMNRYCDERRIPAPRIHEGQAVALFVVALWGLIPFVNLITGIAALFLLVRQIKQWTVVSVAILEARSNQLAS